MKSVHEFVVNEELTSCDDRGARQAAVVLRDLSQHVHHLIRGRLRFRREPYNLFYLVHKCVCLTR